MVFYIFFWVSYHLGEGRSFDFLCIFGEGPKSQNLKKLEVFMDLIWFEYGFEDMVLIWFEYGFNMGAKVLPNLNMILIWRQKSS